MYQVSKQIYQERFDELYKWYREHVHNDDDAYSFNIVDLPGSHLKMIEVVRKQTGTVYHKILIKATYYAVSVATVPQRNVDDLHFLYQVKTNFESSAHTAHQVLFIQLDDQTNVPKAGVLFTWSPHDERYHKFKVG